MHMISRKDLNSAELETVRVSQSATTMVSANGEVQTNGEATVCVKQLDLFVTVMILEEHQQFFHAEKFAEMIVDQVGNLSTSKETVLFLGLSFLQTDFPFEMGIMNDFVQCRSNSRIKYFKFKH